MSDGGNPPVSSNVRIGGLGKIAVKWMRICSPIQLIGEIIAGLLRRLQVCMKYLKYRAELGQEGAKPDPEICREFAGWQ